MRILIVKASALGDIVHAFPAVGFIKETISDAMIDWVVEHPFASLVAAHPCVSRTISVDTKNWRKGLFSSAVRKEIFQSLQALRKEHYDVVFDLQANMKSGLITMLARGDIKVGYSWKGVSEWPNVLCTGKRIIVPPGLSVRDDYLYLVQRYFDQMAPFCAPAVALELTSEELKDLSKLLEALMPIQRPLVMVCYGSNWKNKLLSPDSLLEFLQCLQSHLNCHFVLTWGTATEKCEAVWLQKQLFHSCLLEKVNLPVLQHLMAKMQLVVAMDSLPLHLAATTAVPTFSVFGASLAARYAPTGPQHFAYQGNCPYKRTFPTRCPILRTCPTGACIRSISGRQLFEACLRHFNF